MIPVLCQRRLRIRKVLLTGYFAGQKTAYFKNRSAASFFCIRRRYIPILVEIDFDLRKQLEIKIGILFRQRRDTAGLKHLKPPHGKFISVQCDVNADPELSSRPDDVIINIGAIALQNDSQLIQSRLPISIQVGGMAVTLGAIAGLVLGILAALKRDTVVDSIATIISVIGVSVPSYVFALALSYTFGFKFRWFPMLFSAKDIFGSSVLPSISLSMFTMASIARFTRSEMIEVLDSDYMLLAESKGISGPALIFRHALRNALIPIITVLAPLIVDLMTGSLVVEKIFAIPGVGSLLVTAIQSNDYNVVIGLSFIYSAMYIGIMLVVDLLYGIIDPRIRLAKGDD